MTLSACQNVIIKNVRKNLVTLEPCLTLVINFNLNCCNGNFTNRNTIEIKELYKWYNSDQCGERWIHGRCYLSEAFELVIVIANEY